MKKVYLHGSLGKRFGRSNLLHARNLPEVIFALEANHEGFIECILRAKKDGLEYAIFTKNPKEIKSEQELQEACFNKNHMGLNFKKEELHFVPVPQGGAVVTGIVAAVTGVSFTTMITMTLVSLAISYAINALFKPPEPPKPGKQISTKSYLLSGSKNRQAQGIVVPVGYGRLKIGSVNIDAKNKNSRLAGRGKSTKAYVLESYTDVEYLDVISEGPIEGFVNQNGGVISGGDLREGIFLNNVPIKNQVNGSDIFNYVLNEDDILPELKVGSDSDSTILSDEISILTEYNAPLFGPGPYFNGDTNKPLAYYNIASEAINQGAKIFSHATRNQFVSKFIVSLRASISQSQDDGGTIANSCRFAISISRDGKNENILDLLRSRVLSITVEGKKFSTVNALKEMIDNAGSTSAAASEWAQEGSTYLSSFEKIINLKSIWRNKDRSTDQIAQEFLSEAERNIFKKWHDSEHINPEETLTQIFSPRSTAINVYKEVHKNGGKGGVEIDPRGFFMVSGISTGGYGFDIEIEFDPSVNYDPIRGATIISVVKLSCEYDPAVKSKKDYSSFDMPSEDEILLIKGRANSAKGFIGRTVYNVVADKIISEGSQSSKSIGGITRQRELQLHTVQERVAAKMAYPHSSIVKITFDSKNFKSIPNRTYHVKLKKVLIPSNYDPISKVYTGPWDGLFKGQAVDATGDLIGYDDPINSISDKFKFWTDNPAWIFFDLVQNPRYGLGKYGLEQYNIDKWQLYQVAKYCDELVETRYPIETATNFPRTFVCNNILNDDEEDGELGSFYVLIYKKSFYIDDNSRTVSVDDYETLDRRQFEKEFGNGDSMRGVKVAFFIYQHQESAPFSLAQKEGFAKKSAIRKGNVTIEERVIKSSDSTSKTVTFYGPAFDQNKASFEEDGIIYTIGACCAQISHPIVEHRFSCNLYMNERTEAIQAMNNIASIFRGLVGYNFGKILTLQDSKKNPIMLFNHSNVDKQKGFSYSGIDKNKKFTTVLVRFNNKNKNFAPDLVYEEDPEAMRLFGYQQKEIMGLGITSETQARRLAKWFLFSAQMEVEQISFTASEEASYLYPGCVFEVSDENRAGRNMSGRILDISSFENGSSYFLIDKSARDLISINKVDISVNVGMPNLRDKDLDERAPHHKSTEDQDEEIKSVASPSPQMIRFQCVLSYNPEIHRKGPQGQSSVVSQFMVKLPISLTDNLSVMRIFNHGLEDGDRVRFVSDGILPLGLDKNKIGAVSYYIINSTEHTFQVSSLNSGDPVYILDSGRDNFGNPGGEHFVCIENTTPRGKQVTQSYVDQVEIGAAYYMQGLYGSQVSGAPSLPSNIDNLFIINETTNQNWYKTTIFGDVYIPGGNEWLFSLYLGWIYIGEMREDRSTADEFFWFWWTGVGWVATNENLHASYWWSETEGKWIYVNHIENDQGEDLVGTFFIYDNNHGYTSNQEIILTEGGEYKILSAKNNGYWLISSIFSDSSLAKIFLGQNPPAEPSTSLTASEQATNPGYSSGSIESIEFIDSDSSLQKKNAIKIKMPEGHGLDLYRNRSIEIVQFSSSSSSLDSAINARWQTIYIDDDQVELVDSESASNILQSATVSNAGIFTYVESIKNISLRHFQSQLFRVLSVKELEYRKYEVVGLEYNMSKFEAVDKKLSIKVPSVPIPPQADMALPEAPENLILTDLTI